LLKGKLVEVSTEKAIELSVVKYVFDVLAEGYDEGIKWLSK
jgi:hypothetical protein